MYDSMRKLVPNAQFAINCQTFECPWYSIHAQTHTLYKCITQFKHPSQNPYPVRPSKISKESNLIIKNTFSQVKAPLKL